VLVTGETGTGKELLARAIHDRSAQRTMPLVKVNCAAIPENLLESELFGHVRGAFTGAAANKKGRFALADGGTIFLDEIGTMSPALQAKLLRVLQEREFEPLGSERTQRVDVRVIAATNRDVEADVEAGRFRKDLYYRLNVIRIELPPLRERKSDVRKIARRMVKRFADEFDKPCAGLSREALEALERYTFPGNIRELENIIERAVALSSTPQIGIGDLPDDVSGRASDVGGAPALLPEAGCELDDVLEQIERQLLTQALERTAGVRTHAAELLGISFRSLRYRLAKLGMDTSSDDDD
jgi:two-component system response regulator PilR (NtrC family)